MRASGEMAQLCEQYGVKLICFGVLAGGFLSDKYVDMPEPSPDDITDWSRMKYRRFFDLVGGWNKLQAVLNALRKLRIATHLSNGLDTCFVINRLGLVHMCWPSVHGDCADHVLAHDLKQWHRRNARNRWQEAWRHSGQCCGPIYYATTCCWGSHRWCETRAVITHS